MPSTCARSCFCPTPSTIGPNKSEQLWGFYGTGPVTGPLRADLYFLGFERDRGRFAREERQTLGMRLFGKTAAFDWNIGGVVQLGSFGEAHIARDWPMRDLLAALALDLKES